MHRVAGTSKTKEYGGKGVVKQIEKLSSTSELGLYSGIPQYQNFSRMNELFHVSTMHGVETPYNFEENNEITLPATYMCGGSERNLLELLEETDTSALIVLKNGTVRYEQYWLTGGRRVPWLSMSVAKSFVSALVGIAVAEGHIGSILDPIDAYATSLRGSGYEGVAIKNVLQMSSGCRWNEDYGDPTSEIRRFAFAASSKGSMDEFLSTMVRQDEPGTICRYNSADTQALGLMLANATGKSITEYMQEKLCDPLGFESNGYWLIDGAGRERVYSGLNLTARDFAKFGELYRNGGNWAGNQIIPEYWIAESVTINAPHLAAGRPIVGDHTLPLGYGYQWWILGGETGAFCALGVYNQLIYVDPARGVVIVKLSANPAYGTSSREEVNRDIENVGALRSIAHQFD